jgi:murein DD-endopeptidase MepM/ murein hydrolase activator NlpD
VTQPLQPSATAPLPSATPQPPFAVCSPLQGIALAELGQPDLLKNPFEQPRAGMDDGHHGSDFAYWSRGERSSMLGHPVLAVLSGQVAAVLENRQPYGYAVIIETPLDTLPADWLASREIPAPQPTVPAAPNLSCPPDPIPYGEQAHRSLYLLYAHLDQPPTLTAGQTVTCGDPLGVVGTTGRSVNYHLHLETRVGPAGATFPAMAHYDASASQAEMSTYCTWRVSGLFALFDPMPVLR